MRCTIDRLNFTKAVEFVSQFTLKTSARPVLECVKLVIDRDTLTVSGYDGEAQAEYEVACESRLTTQVIVNAALLRKMLKACDMDELTIEVDGDRDNPTGLVVKNHDDKFDLPNFGSDLPSLPSVGHDYLTLPHGYLARAGAMTVATDQDATRYQLQSVLFKSTDSGLELVTTDGRRLMHYHTPIDTNVQGQWMIPNTVVKRISKLGETEMTANQNMVLFVSGDVKVSCRLIEGRFPDYTKVLESTDGQPAAKRVIDRTMLLGTLKRATLFLADDNRATAWKARGRSLQISAATASVGKAKVSLDCEREEGDANFTTTLDGEMVREMIEQSNDDTVDFLFYGGANAVRFVTGGVTSLLMPMDSGSPQRQEEEATA